MCMCLARGGVGGEGGEWMRELGLGWCYVCVSLDSLCRWQVQVSVYCAWRIPAHLRCTQCSILLHLMDICFLTCICLWQISQIQTFLFKVVGPGLVSTSPTPAIQQVRMPKKWQIGHPLLESAVTVPPLVCMLCRLELPCFPPIAIPKDLRICILELLLYSSLQSSNYVF